MYEKYYGKYELILTDSIKSKTWQSGLLQSGFYIGFLFLVLFSLYLINTNTGNDAWRTIFFYGGIITFVISLLSIIIKESPSFNSCH